MTIKKIDVIKTVADAVSFFNYLRTGLPDKDGGYDLAFDTETENLNRVFNNKFLTWQFSWRAGHAVVIPIDHPEMPLFSDIKDKLKLIDAFQKLLNSSPQETKINWIVAHNSKFDLSILYGLFRILPRGTIPIWDTMLAMHWLDENRKGMSAVLDGSPYALKTLGKELFNFTYNSEQLAARSEGDLTSLSLSQLIDYAATDTILTLALKAEQIRLVQEQPDDALFKLDRFMRYYYSPASRAVAFMECNGIFTSKKQLDYLHGRNSPIWNRIEQIENVDLQQSPEVYEFRKEQSKLLRGEPNLMYEDDIWGAAMTPFNEELPFFNHNKKDQERAFYLGFLKLKPLSFSKKTKLATLDENFLNTYGEQENYLKIPAIQKYIDYYKTPIKKDESGGDIYPKNPLQLIKEHRELSKLGNTYLTGIANMVNDNHGDNIDARVRASFWLSGTDSGRLSSSNPNLQNLPSGRSKMAKEIKNIFQAEPPSRRWPHGTVLIQLDYKTAEVRWAAIFANDKNLIRLFNEARQSLLAASAVDAKISDDDFKKTQLASDIHRMTTALMFNTDAATVTNSMRQASKCLIGETLLYTSKGILPIKQLVPDLDDDNWLQSLHNITTTSLDATPTDICRVNHKWVNYTIKIDSAIGTSICADVDHLLYVWRDNKVQEQCVKDITIDDYLIITRHNQSFATTSPLLSDCHTQQSMPTIMSVSLAYILGFFTADSTCSKYIINSDINIVNDLLQECFFDCFNESLEIDVKPIDPDSFSQQKIAFFKVPKNIREYLLLLGFLSIDKYTQRVPHIIFSSTKNEIVAYLAAFFESEACIYNDRIEVVNLSKNLILDIQQLLLSLNIISLFFIESDGSYRNFYGLKIINTDILLFKSSVGFISTNKNNQLSSIGQSNEPSPIIELTSLLGQTKASPIEANLIHAALIPITKISRIDKRVKVYDIEVADKSHTFLAHGFLSHNCITFGLLYGMGVKTLASKNGWTEEDAQTKMDLFFSAFPDLHRWLERMPKQVKLKGYTETLMGRRRRLGHLYKTAEYKKEAQASRLAMNAPIQGQSSDAGTIGMFSFLQFLLDKELERKWLIQNVVHDSCLIQVPWQDIEKALAAMQHYFVVGMSDYIKKYFDFTLPLPIECELEIGLKYGDLIKWDGRSVTLPKILEKLEHDAKLLWFSDATKPKIPKDLDLVFLG